MTRIWEVEFGEASSRTGVPYCREYIEGRNIEAVLKTARTVGDTRPIVSIILIAETTVDAE